MAEDHTLQLMITPALTQLPRDRLVLTMVTGPHPGAVQEVDVEVVLGRGEDLPHRIDDRGMSRRHARITKLGQHYVLEDLGSTNGTRVNGERITQPRQIHDGDRIQLGESTMLRANLSDAREAEAARKLYASATLDPLTQIYNRGHFDDRLSSEYAYARRHGTPLTVLLFDIDHFKEVNDTHGHPCGDAVLQAMAAVLGRVIREEDLLARYGGEEFAIVARGVERVGGLQLGERVRTAVERMAVPWQDQTIRITVSVGVACHGQRARYASAEELLLAADQAVYRAKSEGRNRVVGA
jgi:two-component system cell cycle response regulator